MESMKEKTEEADDRFNRRIKTEEETGSAGSGLKLKLDQQRTYANRQLKRHVIRKGPLRYGRCNFNNIHSDVDQPSLLGYVILRE